ncbi:helix-turn-helix domain-containing protein [Saccharopolyspora terrae]|nr:helix-turn-helix transcriptional regulator [Saccharopolyspora terrae]
MSRRALLGRELRRLRKRKGWTGPQLAQLLGWSQSKVSRLETGQRSAALADVTAWLDVTETEGDPRTRVLDLAESLLGQITGLRALHQGSLVRRQVELQSIDSEAQLVRQFQPLMAPGVFHTETYARACIASANLTAERDLDSAVAARLERGRRVLSGEGPVYHVVLCESALRWRPHGCSPEQLRRLWHRVAEIVDHRNITLQVIPDSTPTTALPQCGFSMWSWGYGPDSQFALVETPAAEVTFTSSEDIAMFERVWHEMIKVALSPEQSRGWIIRFARI